MTGDDVLGFIEAVNSMAEHLDQLKTNLESRGWSTPAAEQASIAVTNTLLIKARF